MNDNLSNALNHGDAEGARFCEREEWSSLYDGNEAKNILKYRKNLIKLLFSPYRRRESNQ